MNENGELEGIFSSDDVRGYLIDDSLWELANASDIMTTDLITITPKDDLNTALRRFTQLNIDELPVVEEKNPRILLGMLRRKDVIGAYNQRLMAHRQELEKYN